MTRWSEAKASLEIESLPPPTWLIDGIIPARGLAVLYGQPGLGKTFLAMDWGFCAAKGIAWQGRAIREGRSVVYVAAEGASGLGPRVRAWKKARGVEGKAGVSFLSGALNMLKRGEVDSLLSLIQEAGLTPGLVVLDTLARCMEGGDENSARDMGLLVAQADLIRSTLDATVLLIHHPQKAGPLERGSGALRGAADTFLVLRKHRTEMHLICEKQKDAQSFPLIAMRLRLIPLGDGHESCVVEPATAQAVEDAAPLTPKHLDVLRALRSLPAGDASSGKWLAKAKDAGIPPRTFYRIRKDLLDRNYVGNAGSEARPLYLPTLKGRTATAK